MRVGRLDLDGVAAVLGRLLSQEPQRLVALGVGVDVNAALHLEVSDLNALRVRIDDGKQLARGEQALIVDYDAERETYLVEPMRDLMEAKK